MPPSVQRAASPIILNVYDLHPMNENLIGVGLGFYHSGLEIHGSEYSFGEAGIFQNTPKEAPPAIFRVSIPLGETRLG